MSRLILLASGVVGFIACLSGCDPAPPAEHELDHTEAAMRSPAASPGPQEYGACIAGCNAHCKSLPQAERQGCRDKCRDTRCGGTGAPACDGPNPPSHCVPSCTCPDDGNPCTTDACDAAGVCRHAPVADGLACADADRCDGTETCQAGVCAAGDPVVCADDGDPCTHEGCEPSTGDCVQSLASGLATVTLQPGPGESMDKFLRSSTPQDPMSSAFDPQGTNPTLRVGGWGDQYRTLIRFEVAGLPEDPVDASLELFCHNTYNPPTMSFERITSAWGLTTTWASRPSAVTLGTRPAAIPGQWYRLDVSALVPGWIDGSLANFGVQLVPNATNNNYDEFRSGDFAEDPTLRPRLVLTYDCDDRPSPCATSDVCSPLCEGLACDDGDDCTSGDTCTAGVCSGTSSGCVDDGDACTSETCLPDGGCERRFTCATVRDGTLAFETLPALGADGTFHTAGRVVPVSWSAPLGDPRHYGLSYALRSSDLSTLWGGLPSAPNCQKNAGPHMPTLDEVRGLVLTNGDWNDGQIGDYCASIFAKSAATGAAVWDAQPGGPHPRHPIAITDKNAFYGGTWGQIKMFDLADGSVDAGMNLAVGYSEGGGLVLTSGGDLIASQWNHKTERWTPAGVKVWTSTALKGVLHMTAGDDVVGFNPGGATLVRLDGATGSAEWSVGVVGGVGAILTDAQGFLYHGETGEIVSRRADGSVGWRTAVGGTPEAQFLGDDENVYFRTWSTLFAIDTRDGSVAWRFDAVPGAVSVESQTRDNGFAGFAALLAGGDIFLNDYAGRLYRLQRPGLGYAQAPWARPRGDRANTGRQGSWLPMP